ncbi:MAG: type II toxin-antitoxin system VapC family toxin [Planctomycetes bacterium]|nr:type II toxin-antitoxin system VapC family toxin [Planctomycetota bacterium]
MIVVDASAILELLLRTPDAPRVQARLFRRDEPWHAPELVDVEVVQVLRRYVLSETITEERGEEALEVFAEMRIARHPHALYIPRMWQLRHNATAYDAAYLALAEGLGAPLVTRDARLSAVPGHTAAVELL